MSKSLPQYLDTQLSRVGAGQTVGKALAYIHEAMGLLWERSSTQDNRHVRVFGSSLEAKEDQKTAELLVDLMQGIRQEAKIHATKARRFPERSRGVGVYERLMLDDRHGLSASDLIGTLQQAQHQVLRRLLAKRAQPDGTKKQVFHKENERPRQDSIAFASLTQCVLSSHNQVVVLCNEGRGCETSSKTLICTLPMMNARRFRPLEEICEDYRKIDKKEIFSKDPWSLTHATIDNLIGRSSELLDRHIAQAQFNSASV